MTVDTGIGFWLVAMQRFRDHTNHSGHSVYVELRRSNVDQSASENPRVDNQAARKEDNYPGLV